MISEKHSQYEHLSLEIISLAMLASWTLCSAGLTYGYFSGDSPLMTACAFVILIMTGWDRVMSYLTWRWIDDDEQEEGDG